MKPIIRWTLWQRRWSIFWWSFGIALFVILTMAFYPAFRDQSSQLDKSLQNIPETARAFISDTNDLLSPTGYLSSQIFYLLLPMLLSILAINLGSSLIAREEESATIELLLSRPLYRTKLLFGKALGGLLIVLIVSAVALVALLVLCKLVNIEVALPRVAGATLMATVLSLTFGTLAFMVTTLGKTARLASVGAAALVALASYILASLAGVVDWLLWPARLLPYHYYHPGDILKGSPYWHEALGLVAVILIIGLISWLAFRKRDVGA